MTSDRVGHCVYFATATTLLLRTLGVPARVVMGYKGGNYNDLIDVVEVNEDSAHAWVEAYIPDYGWQTLDPTPDGGASAGTISTWRRYATALSFWFRQYVVDYDESAQQELIKSIKTIGKQSKNEPFDWRVLLGRFGKAGAVGGVCAVAGVGIWWARQRRRVTRAMPRYYRVFLGKVAAKDLRRRRGETLREFHRRCVAAGVDEGVVVAVDQAIEEDFYGAAEGRSSSPL